MNLTFPYLKDNPLKTPRKTYLANKNSCQPSNNCNKSPKPHLHRLVCYLQDSSHTRLVAHRVLHLHVRLVSEISLTCECLHVCILPLHSIDYLVSVVFYTTACLCFIPCTNVQRSSCACNFISIELEEDSVLWDNKRTRHACPIDVPLT